MNFYKFISNGYIAAFGEIGKGERIASAEYNALLAAVNERPNAPDGHIYRLRAADLSWELVELPPMPEPELTDEEALEILLGGAT